MARYNSPPHTGTSNPAQEAAVLTPASNASESRGAWIDAVLSHPFFIPVCFALFVSFRLLVLLVAPVTPESDAAWYVERGAEIAAHQGYHEGVWPTAFWPVGFPAYLGAIFAISGTSLAAAKAMNLVLSCGIFVTLYRFAFVVFRERMVARLSVAILTLYPNQVAYTGLLLCEMLSTFLLLAGIVLFVENRSWACIFGSGVAFGLGTLVKAQLLLLPFILLAEYAWHRRRAPKFVGRTFALAAFVALGMLVAIGPWSIRNAMVLHSFIPVSTNGGYDFLIGNNPEATGGYSEENSLLETVHFSVQDQVAADERAYRLAIGWIKRHPLRFLELAPLKIWHLWAPDGDAEWAFEAGYPRYMDHFAEFRALRFLNQAYYLLSLVIFAFAALKILGCPERRPFTALPAWIALYITVISVAFFGSPRFHFPAMPFLFAYGGWSGAWLASRERAQQAIGTKVLPR